MYHPWIRKFRQRKSGVPYLTHSSTEDLHSLLHSVNAPSNLYGMDYIKDEEIVKIVKENADNLVQKFEERSFVWTSPEDIHSDTLKVEYCNVQAENRLLHLLVQNLNEKLQKSNSSSSPSSGTKKAIERVEQALVKNTNDFRLAQTVYNCSNIPYQKFDNGKKGILLMRKVNTKKQGTATFQKWRKRWILLQNDFLFCYKPECEEDNPVVTILLRNPKIIPIPERDVGKKNCFQLTTTSGTYQFAAANPEILIKWLYSFDAMVPWFYSDNSILDDIPEQSEEITLK